MLFPFSASVEVGQKNRPRRHTRQFPPVLPGEVLTPIVQGIAEGVVGDGHAVVLGELVLPGAAVSIRMGRRDRMCIGNGSLAFCALFRNLATPFFALTVPIGTRHTFPSDFISHAGLDSVRSILTQNYFFKRR